MFFDNFQRFCTLVGKKPNTVAKELSISSGSITAWKNGRVPSAGRLQSIAAYFTAQIGHSITVNDLLCDKNHIASSKDLDKIHTPVIQKIVKICSEDPDAADDILLFAEALQRRNKK